jgi:hypothetical protein
VADEATEIFAADKANVIAKAAEADKANQSDEAVVLDKAVDANKDDKTNKAVAANEAHKANEISNAVGAADNVIMLDDAPKAQEAIIIRNKVISITKFSAIFAEVKEYFGFKNNN